MNKSLIAVAAAAGMIFGASANAAVDAAKAKQLATKYNCLACHAVDKKLVGPSYQDVAKKYKGDKPAVACLVKVDTRVGHLLELELGAVLTGDARGDDVGSELPDGGTEQ